MILRVSFSQIWSPVSQKPRHDRCKPRSYGVRGKSTSRAPHGYVHLVACAGIDRIRTGNQDIGTQRRRSAEKSRSRWDHQNQTRSTGLNIMARRSTRGGRQQPGSRPRGSTKRAVAEGRRLGSCIPGLGRSFRPAAERRTGMVATESARGRSACKTRASALHHGALHVAHARVFQNPADVSLHAVHDPLTAEISHLLHLVVLSKSAGTRLKPDKTVQANGLKKRWY